MSTAFPVNPSPRFTVSTATAGQAAFSALWPIQQADDAAVKKTDTNGVTTALTRGVHYTITGAGSPSGFTVTLKPAYLAKAGEIYTLYGAAVLARTENVTRGGKYDSKAHDADLDRLTLIAQEHDRDIARAVKVPFGGTPPDLAIGADGTVPKWQGGKLVEGPSAAALEALEAALAVEAGRALVHGEGGSDPYDAGGRKIVDVADGVEPGDAVNKGQLDALELSVDAEGLAGRVTTLEQGWRTGDFKFTFDSVAAAGWLKAQGGTIGDATSGATVLAHADAEALFLFLHAKFDDTALPIFTSDGNPSTRGVAADDWTAHKRLTLPDLSDRFPRAGSGTRAVGLKEANQNKSHNHTATFSGNALPAHSHANGGYNQLLASNSSGTSTNNDNTPGEPNLQSSATIASVSAGTPSGTVTVNNDGGTEARPDSFVLLPLIKL